MAHNGNVLYSKHLYIDHNMIIDVSHKYGGWLRPSVD